MTNFYCDNEYRVTELGGVTIIQVWNGLAYETVREF